MNEPAIVIKAFILFLLVIFLCQNTANAQDAKSRRSGGILEKNGAFEAIDADGKSVALPKPPPDLAKLIEVGKVRFEFYDPKVVQRSFAGETEFEYRYRYESRSNWQRTDDDRKPGIRVTIAYQNVVLERSHRILLPQELIRDDLFERPLTLHEFDHVRISADARLPALLRTMLEERNASLVVELDEEEHGFKSRPTREDLARISKQLAKEASDRVFNDFVEIVSIRYRELDRISRYGLETLTPQDRDRLIDAPPTPAPPASTLEP